MSIMRTLFGGNSPDLLGLDISSSSVKVLELSRRGDRFHVESYAVEPLPPNAVNDRQITDPRIVGECIARAVNRTGSKTRRAALAVSGASVITKIIQMSANLSEQDLEEQIKAEADQYIPYPLDEVNLDFQVLGTSDKGTGMTDVLLAACRKEQIEQRCAALEIAGLTPTVVDVEAYALENACRFLQHQMPDQGKGKTIAVVDIGAGTTSVLVLHDMQTIYTREQAFGGRHLTEEIMREYGMTFDEAVKAQRLNNLPAGYETEVLDRFVSDLAQQIDRSLQFFFASSSQHNHIEQLILAGGCARIPELDVMLQERLQIPAVIAKPFAGMSVSSKAKPSVLAKDEASLLIACGLAWRAFDEERA